MERHPRIAFLWDGINKYGDSRFRDGLWKALKHIESDGWTVGWFEPLDAPGIENFKPDGLLFWGALAENVKPKVVTYPYKKAICFAGGPIDVSNVDGFDMYFTESRINEIDFDMFKKPHMRAFGVNEEIFYPMNLKKEYKAMIAATFAMWKRHILFAEAVGKDGIAVGVKQDVEPECWQVCEKYGVPIIEEQPREVVAQYINKSLTVVNTSSFWGGGQRLTLEAMACNVPPIVMADSPKNIEYVQESGFGMVVDPCIQGIREAVYGTTWKPSNAGRDYIMSKWTSRHYAESLKHGLLEIL